MSTVGGIADYWWIGDGTTRDIVSGIIGTLVNGASYAPGVAGQAFSFNGNYQNVSMPANAVWNFGPCDFSISLWAKANSADAVAPLVSQDEGPGNVNKWIFWVQPGGGLTFHINSPASGPNDIVIYRSGAFHLTPGQWHHLAVTKTGTEYVLYVDGRRVAAASGPKIVPSASAPLMIGQAEDFPFNGSIDEVKIYRRGLSHPEIRTYGFLQGVKAIADQ
jgi:hypothetical protein